MCSMFQIFVCWLCFVTIRAAWCFGKILCVCPPVVDHGILTAGIHWPTAVGLEYVPPTVIQIANRWTAAYSTQSNVNYPLLCC